MFSARLCINRAVPRDAAAQARPRVTFSTRCCHAFLACIDHEAPAAQESHQCQTHFARQLNGEAGRRGNRRDHWHPRHDRFLHDFKSATAADQQYRIRERHAAFQQRPANHFVHGVVTADILAQN